MRGRPGSGGLRSRRVFRNQPITARLCGVSRVSRGRFSGSPGAVRAAAAPAPRQSGVRQRRVLAGRARPAACGKLPGGLGGTGTGCRETGTAGRSFRNAPFGVVDLGGCPGRSPGALVSPETQGTWRHRRRGSLQGHQAGVRWSWTCRRVLRTRAAASSMPCQVSAGAAEAGICLELASLVGLSFCVPASLYAVRWFRKEIGGPRILGWMSRGRLAGECR